MSPAGSDAVGDQPSVRVEGLMLALLGTAEPETLHTWFERLADGRRVVDPLGPKPWGASDGQAVDRFGLHWLIGCEASWPRHTEALGELDDPPRGLVIGAGAVAQPRPRHPGTRDQVPSELVVADETA